MAITSDNPLVIAPIEGKTYDVWWLWEMKVVADDLSPATLTKLQVTYKLCRNMPDGSKELYPDETVGTKTLFIPDLFALASQSPEVGGLLGQVIEMLGQLGKVNNAIT